MTDHAASLRRRYEHFGPLTEGERAAIERLVEPPFDVRRRATIQMEGDANPSAFLLTAGWVASTTARHDGGRLLLKAHLPGEILAAPSLSLARAAETLSALTDARVARLSLPALRDFFTDHPRLAAMMFTMIQNERVVVGDRLTAIARSSADSSVAGFLLGIYRRLSAVDPHQSTAFDLPLTLDDIGDALGLTPVHVSRTLTKLAAAGLMVRRGRRFELLDLERLERMAGMSKRVPLDQIDWLPAARG